MTLFTIDIPFSAYNFYKMKKIRVLQILPAFNTGGVEEGALAVSNALQAHGHHSFIASSGGRKVSEAESNGAKHIALPLAKKNPFIFLSLICNLAKIIRENEIDIIHARSRWPAWISYFAAKRCQVPFITTFHGVHKSQNFIKRLYNSIMVRSGHVISISDYVTNYINHTYAYYLKSYKTHIHTIPRGLDHNYFDPDKVLIDEIELLKTSWQIDPKQKVILLPARMTRLKGHHILIEALSKIDNSDLIAVFVGGHTDRAVYQQELETKIKENGLENKIRIVPAIKQMAAAYMLADIVVFPSTQAEAFGRIVIESQAMGVPIITSNIGAQTTLVKNGQTGWLFENGDADDLAEKINSVINLSDKDKAEYAETARQAVVENYTQDIMCQRTIEVYKEVLREKL